MRTADIDASPDEVWSVLEDVRLLPQLSPSTKQVLGAPERLTRPGDTFSQVVRLLGRSYTSDWVVKRLERGRLLSIEGTIGFGVGYCLTQEIEPLGGEQSGGGRRLKRLVEEKELRLPGRRAGLGIRGI